MKRLDNQAADVAAVDLEASDREAVMRDVARIREALYRSYRRLPRRAKPGIPPYIEVCHQ